MRERARNALPSNTQDFELVHYLAEDNIAIRLKGCAAQPRLRALDRIEVPRGPRSAVSEVELAPRRAKAART